MNKFEEKQSTAEADFERCRENYCEATARLLDAVNEHCPDDCKALHDSLTPACEKITAIRNDINAAKRNERMGEIVKRMPKEGDEALVELCPCPHGGQTWMQRGNVLLAWHEDDERVEDAIFAVIEITEEENDRYWSEAYWIGCKFVCRLSYRGYDWRALWPANDQARKEWGCDEVRE